MFTWATRILAYGWRHGMVGMYGVRGKTTPLYRLPWRVIWLANHTIRKESKRIKKCLWWNVLVALVRDIMTLETAKMGYGTYARNATGLGRWSYDAPWDYHSRRRSIQSTGIQESARIQWARGPTRLYEYAMKMVRQQAEIDTIKILRSLTNE